MIQTQYFDRVRYVLACKEMAQEVIIEVDPIGWKADDKEFARNEDYDGIFPKFSNNLKFIGDAADLINTAKDLYGINSEIKLTKFQKHPRTDNWTRTYWGYLDLSTWGFENGQVSVKFNSGGLEQLIKARESEQIEIDRPDTIDGVPLDPLVTNEFRQDGRRIFLRSQWEDKSPGDSHLYVSSNSGGTRNMTIGIPLTLTSQSHEQAQSVIVDSFGTEMGGNPGALILAIFDRPRTITLTGEDISFYTKITNSDFQWAFFRVCVTVYKDGSDFNLKERRDVLNFENAQIWSIHEQTLTVPNFTEIIDVEEGDSIALEFYIKADLMNFDTSDARFSVRVSNVKGTVIAEEDSVFPPSTNKFILAHEFYERLTSICGNAKNIFVSDYFGRQDLGYPSDGPGAYLGFSHGFWIRGFDKLPLSTEESPNLFKPLTTSLQDALKSAAAVLNVGVGIEEVNGRERFRIEDKKYFYNPNITIRLPLQVKKVKRSIATKYYASSVEIGYESGGDYSEAQGLDEPNGVARYTTVITRIKEALSLLSIYRADGYGKEFTRRKPKTLFPTEDTPGDENTFWLDLKRGLGSLFYERKWQDDFEQAPTGIFSPDTAVNLRLSPFNNLLRHGWVIAAGLTKYPMDYVRYGSSTANSRLKTKLVGHPEYAENGNILNAELGTARYVPEYIEFEHDCSFDIMQEIQGNSIILGRSIPNIYGTIEFINERNESEKGFLMSLKPEKGQWKVLKSNR